MTIAPHDTDTETAGELGSEGVDGPGLDIRIAGEDDGASWHRAMMTGFLMPWMGPEHSAAWWQRNFDSGRLLGAWDGPRCVATFRAIPTRLTVPGGAELTADLVAGVTVTSTHRHRGLLTAMMERGLTAARERGAAFALLNAAEHGIYGRYGFGPATRASGWSIDLPRSGGLSPQIGQLAVGARIELITLDELAHIGPALHERVRTQRHGAISRPPLRWRYDSFSAAWSGLPGLPPFVAVHRERDGLVTAVLTYRLEHNGILDGEPDITLTVVDHLAATPAAAGALWRHAFDIPWVRRLTVPHAAPDDPLPLALVNPRAAKLAGDGSKDLWLRLLDAPRAFAARTYDVPAATVLQVHDPLGHVTGCWRLATADDGTGTLTATTAEPELEMNADALASVYLGGVTVPQLLAAGRIRQLRDGAAARAGLQLRTALDPWCPDTF